MVSWSNYSHPTGVVNRFTGPPSHSPQQPCNQKDTHLKIIIRTILCDGELSSNSKYTEDDIIGMLTVSSATYSVMSPDFEYRKFIGTSILLLVQQIVSAIFLHHVADL